jgi:ABC-2 type transport system ATP-binding protein
MGAIITVTDLVKKYNGLAAVKGISFEVECGGIFGFLGPNGAGKSTTIKMLATLLRPTSGRAAVAGFDIATQPDKVRQSIGIVFQDPSLDERLTALENLIFHAMLYSVSGAVLKERLQYVLDLVGLADRRHSAVKTFSGGMKRRLEIARGLLHHPEVLFLDEPTLGLDPQTRRAIWDHVIQLRREEGVTVFMTTHYMDEAENCDRIAIIDQGEIQALDSPEGLKRLVGGDMMIVKGNLDLERELASRYGVPVKCLDDECRFQVAGGAEFVPRLVEDFQGRVKSVQVKQPSLDDVFLHLTGKAIREEEGTEIERMRERRRVWKGRK